MSWSRAPEPDNLLAQNEYPDLMLLACTVLGEAEGESDDGKIAVAWTVINRAEDSKRRWPKDIGAVCLQPFQYSAWQNPRRLSVMRTPRIHVSPTIWEACFKAACGAMFKLLPDPTGGATHYLNEHVVLATVGKLPSWFHEAAVTVRMDAHTFLAI